MKLGQVCVVLAVALTSVMGQVASHSPAKLSSMSPALSGQSANKPVARVNGAVLTQDDLLQEMYTIFPYARLHSGFPKSQEAEIRKGALNMIVFEELVYQEAERRHMTIPPARLNLAMAQLRKRFPNDTEFQRFVQAHGSRENVRKKIRRSLLIEALLKSEIESKSIIPAARVKEYYDHHQEEFRIPESLEFQSISIIPPNGANADALREAHKKAEDALRKAKATNSYETFGLLAEKLSEDNYRVNMGDHHRVPCSVLPPQIVKAASTMPIGAVSELIQIENAYTIFRLNRHVSPGLEPYEKVRAQVRQNLQKDRAEQLRSAWDNRLRKTAKVEIL